eukprot:3589893-Amphidinium_carterae.1
MRGKISDHRGQQWSVKRICRRCRPQGQERSSYANSHSNNSCRSESRSTYMADSISTKSLLVCCQRRHHKLVHRSRRPRDEVAEFLLSGRGDGR